MPSMLPLPRASASRWRPGRAIAALMLREMSTSYGRSPGGYIWAILEPVAGIALLSALFSLAFRAPALGQSFALFYATGMLPFMCFFHLSGRIAQSIEYSRPLLAYPAVSWIDAILARFALNLATQVLVGYIVLAGILLIFRTRAVLDPGPVLLGYTMAAVLALGIGTLNCLLQGLFPVWTQAWAILMRPMFLISTIFYLFEGVPQPWRDALWYNPLVHAVAMMRRGFYPGYDAPWVSTGYVFGLGLTCLATGLLFLLRYNRDILNR